MHRTTRRSFVAGLGAGAAALVALRDPFAFAQSGVPVARGGSFAQGVASGQQTDTGITLWSRVGGLDGPGRVQFEVARDPGFANVIRRQDALVDPAGGFTALQRVEGLAPGEEYFYRCFTCDTTSSVGRFRTAKADSNDPVRIGFFSCQAYEAGFYTPHSGLAREADLDLVVCLGDYIYERNFYGEEGVRPDRTGANRDGEVQTLPEYRDKYALYHSDRRLVDVRQTYPIMAIWDDHEVEDNYARDLAGDATLNKRVEFPQRRSAAYQAFFEHMPRIRVPGDPDRIYGSMTLGRHAELFLLDQRQYRDDQPCGDSGPGCGETGTPRRFLGESQLAWLKDGLTRSPATWKVVGNQLMIMSFDIGAPGNPLIVDSWDGYAAERTDLLTTIRDRGVKDVTFITGDIHTFFAGRVTPSGRQRPGLDPAPVATEFVGGSITSEGVTDTLSPDDRADLLVTIGSERDILLTNPQLEYVEGRRRGYGVLEARGDALEVTFRSPVTVKDDGVTDIDTIARFTVAKGTTDVVAADVRSGTTQLP